MTDILVTGAAGFIGYHVARRLLDRGDKVVAELPSSVKSSGTLTVDSRGNR